jgi:hypothetical protein
MNVDEAIDTLVDVARAIFPGTPSSNSDPETNTKQLVESLKTILHTRGIPPDRKMQDTAKESVGCKVYVYFPHASRRITFFRALYAAATANLSHPIVLRNYKPRGSSLNPTIIDAICATMAIPLYFSPIKIGAHGRQQTFVGGPLGAYNPTRELLKEASTIFGKQKLLIQLISLGCGRSHVSSMNMHSDAEGFSRGVQEMAVDCETVEKELSTRFCDMNEYLRLNVNRGMENLLINVWDDLGAIETHTSAYAATVSEMIDASLTRLQGSTGALTLGQISEYSYTDLEPLSRCKLTYDS